jgi:uncharacterized protein
MKTTNSPRSQILTFLAITFLLSAIFWAIILLAGGTKAYGGLPTLGLMWCPGISAILTKLYFERSLKSLGWKPGKFIWLALAYLLPILYAVFPYAIAWVSGLAGFNTTNLPAGRPLVPFIIINLTFVFLLGSLPSALGEEIGWRGLLVPQLALKNSIVRSGLISGAIWAVWHLPLIVFGDYNSGAPVLYAVLCFVVLVLGISIPLAWLRMKSGSLWTAAVLHASHNLVIQAILDVLTTQKPLTPFITTEFGAGLALSAVVIGFIFWQISQKEELGRVVPAPIP